jgi:alkylation response protein AidB-like acyl-CoA dehydrogenase
MGRIEDRARVIADDVLFPAALQVDADDVIPLGHFAVLAAEGFYGLAGRVEDGGAEVDVLPMAGIIETLTGGCLATTFTWMQHHGVVRGLANTANDQLRGKYLDAAVRGELRAGVAYAGAIPQPPRLWATATDGGWLLSGEAPLVSGWGIIDLLLISARDTSPGDGSGLIVNILADAGAGGLDGIAVTELHLIAAQASNTVRLHFEDYFVAAEQVVSEISHQDFLANQHIGARLNGSLALGIAGRCIRLIGEAGEAATATRLTAEQDAVRRRLDDGLGTPDTVPAARAVASEFAYRAAGALVVAIGSSGIMAGSHAERLVREATFTLVAAGRPEIKRSLLEGIPRVVS